MRKYDPFQYTMKFDFVSEPSFCFDFWNQHPELIGIIEGWKRVYYYDNNGNYVPSWTSISTYGRAYDHISLRWFWPSRLMNTGYYTISIGNKERLVHRAVMETFLPVANMNELQVNHKDEVKTHNWITNLEWMTPAENTRYSISTGTIKKYGEFSNFAKINDEIAEAVAQRIAFTDMRYQEIADELGISLSTVSGIANSGRWKHVTEKYHLDNIRRKRARSGCEVVKRVCEFFQKFKSDGRVIKFGERPMVFKEAAVYAGLDPNSKSDIRFIDTIYYRAAYKDICKEYDY